MWFNSLIDQQILSSNEAEDRRWIDLLTHLHISIIGGSEMSNANQTDKDRRTPLQHGTKMGTKM